MDPVTEKPVSSSTLKGGERLCHNLADSENSPRNPTCYGPLTTFEELIVYETCLDEESKICRSKTIPLADKSFGNGKLDVRGERVDQSSSGKHPLTLVCHDLKGGYGDDR